MSDDIVTVSAKLPKGLRDRLDEIGEELEISNRSALVRMALESFVERHESDGIPRVESKTEGAERKRMGFEEMCGIPQGSGAPSPRNGRGNGRK